MAVVNRQMPCLIPGISSIGKQCCAFGCIGRERADLVVAGCAILESILDIWPADRLGVADRGIREGILRSLMARDGWPLPDRWPARRSPRCSTC